MRLQQDTVNILIRNECETKHGTIKLNIRIFFETFIFFWDQEIAAGADVSMLQSIDYQDRCFRGMFVWRQLQEGNLITTRSGWIHVSTKTEHKWSSVMKMASCWSHEAQRVASPQLRLRSSLVTCWLSACMDPSGVPAARSRAQRRVVDCFFGQTARDNLCERTDRFNFT